MPSRLTLVAIAVAVLSLTVLALDTDLGNAGSPPFVVDTVADTVDDNIGNNICADSSGNCSIRAAIQEANAAPEVHEIHFGGSACAFTCIFEPTSPLPTLSRDNVRIDGLTHPAYNGTPQAKIFGTSAGPGADGLTLTGSSIDVAGLAIFSFSGNGITINGGSDYLIEHNTISNHGVVGVSVSGSNASLISNSIGGSPTGIYTIGDGHTAHFNNIFSNGTGAFDEGFTFFLDAENNWWGCNEGPGQPGCDTASGPIDADPWLVLDLEASPTSIPGGGTSDLTASLTDNSDGFDMSGSGLIPDFIAIFFETTLGSVGSSSVFKSTTDGTAQVTLTADEGPGLADITATLHAESVFAAVTITSAPPLPTPTPSPTPSPTGSPTPTPAPTATSTPQPSASTTTAPSDQTWGDLDCDGTVGTRDSQAILRNVLEQPALSQTQPCPLIGDLVQVSD